MKRYRKPNVRAREIALFFVALIMSLSFAPRAAAKTYHVYFLAGQSNMDGYGFNEDLPAGLQDANSAIRIFHGRTVADGEAGGGVGVWSAIAPGHGTGFDTDGGPNALSDRFGPELSFASRLAVLRPEENVAIIKFARGGTALIDGVSGYGSWDPDYDKGNGRNQYDYALSAIRRAIAARDLDGDGVEDRLIPAGIAWMQGEADAYDNRAAAENYAANLRRLMGLFRAAFHANDLPVAIGRIKDSGSDPETRVMAFSGEVRAAQAAFANSDRCAALVTASDDFGFLPDGWHYRSEDYLALGAAFAEAIDALRRACPLAD